MTKPQAHSLVTLLKTAYYPKDVPDTTAKLYANRLQRYDYDTARVALGKLLDTKTFWPSLAEIAQAYHGETRNRRLNATEDPLPELTAEQQAENVRRIRLLAENLARPRHRRADVETLLRQMGLEDAA